jgi:nucleotide-binding universal stress UspA family protein
MIQRREAGSIVVGVDGSGSALDALDWAAAEAASRRRPLRVVHAFTGTTTVDQYGVAAGDGGSCLTAAELVLAEAVACARSVAPDSRITARLVVGDAARAMLDQAWMPS